MAVERFALGDPAQVAAARAARWRPAPRRWPTRSAGIVAAVRARGDAALREYVERFDDVRGPLRVARRRAAARARRPRPRRPRRPGGGDRQRARGRRRRAATTSARSRCPQGQVVRLREVPVRRAAIYVPGGRAPYPSTVVMGVVTARAAGVEEVVVCAPGRAPGHPRRLRAVRGRRGLPHGRRPRGRRARLRHRERRRAPTSSPAPATSTCRRPSAWSAATSASTASPGPPTCSCSPPRAPTPRSSRSTSPPRPSTARARIVCAVERRPGAARRDRTSTPGDGGAPRWSDAPDLEAALAFAEAFAPEHLELIGAEAEALAPRVRSAGCVFVGRRRAPPPSATTSRARTTRCPPAARRASPRA